MTYRDDAPAPALGPPDDARDPARRERSRRTVVLVALSLAFGLIQLDATIVNVALETLRAELGGDVGAAQWLVDGYAVPFAACMLAAGVLGDRYGHRRACVLGFVLFGLASVCAASADGWAVLIGARALQGVGAAMMLPSSLALIGHLYPERRARSRALGVWGGVATAGFAGGPLLGGLLITGFGWPAIFWVNVPVVIAVGGTIALLAPHGSTRRSHADLRGTVLAVLALTMLTGAVIETGQRHVGVASALTLGGLAAGWLLVRTERRSTHPLLPAEVLAPPGFRWALATGFAFNFAMYGAILCVSLTLQAAYGFSALSGGLALVPMALVISVGAPCSGFLAAAYGPRPPMIAGFACAVVGAVVVGAGALVSSSVVIIVGLTTIGLCSLAMPAMTSVALNAAPSAHAGLAGGALNTARQLGGAVAVAALGAILNAGGYRDGLVAGSAFAAAVCGLAVLSSVKATRRTAGPERAEVSA